MGTLCQGDSLYISPSVCLHLQHARIVIITSIRTTRMTPMTTSLWRSDSSLPALLASARSDSLSALPLLSLLSSLSFPSSIFSPHDKLLHFYTDTHLALFYQVTESDKTRSGSTAAAHGGCTQVSEFRLLVTPTPLFPFVSCFYFKPHRGSRLCNLEAPPCPFFSTILEISALITWAVIFLYILLALSPQPNLFFSGLSVPLSLKVLVCYFLQQECDFLSSCLLPSCDSPIFMSSLSPLLCLSICFPFVFHLIYPLVFAMGSH